MSGTIELGLGQSVTLPEVAFLQVKVTGDTQNTVLRAVSAAGFEVTDPATAGAYVNIRPQPDGGWIDLRILPADGDFFHSGIRVGLELLPGAGAQDSDYQILMSPRDVGAFGSVVLARCEFVDPVGWTIVSGGTRVSEEELDERAYPWLRSGRYAVRRFDPHEGTLGRLAGRPWALVLDSSVSTRTLGDREAQVKTVEFLAGVFAEATGAFPAQLGLSGNGKPNWELDSVKEPGELAKKAFDSVSPPSWFLCVDAVQDAYNQGVQTVVVLGDGLPADLERLTELVKNSPGLTVSLLVVVRSLENSPLEDSEDSSMNPVFGFSEGEVTGLNVSAVSIDDVIDGDSTVLSSVAKMLLGGVQ